MADPETRAGDNSTDQFTEMAWIKFLGIEPLDAGEGRAVIRLDPEPVHLNHNGTVNAPILYALAEVAGAGAVVAGMLELAARSYTVVKRGVDRVPGASTGNDHCNRRDLHQELRSGAVVGGGRQRSRGRGTGRGV